MGSEVIDKPESIQTILRKLEEFGAELSREGVAAPPSMARVAASLAELRGAPEERIIIAPPVPPPVPLPPGLQPRWDAFEAYFNALSQWFGNANRDQVLLIARIAAVLGIGEPANTTTATWDTFIDMLTRLTSALGTLNNDQYLTVLDVAADLSTGITTGTPGTFVEAPATGAVDGYLRNGLTGTWQRITLLDGGAY